MISRSDVIEAYRVVLGRKPESEQVIQHHRAVRGIPELYEALISSEEFREVCEAKLGTADRDRYKPLNWPPTSIELAASSDQMARMLQHIETYWREIDSHEVHAGMLHDGEFWSSALTASERGFYDTGREILEILAQTAARCGVSLGEYKSCVELGCGVGRLTVWLADLFPAVLGVDISPVRIQLNKRALARFGRRNVEHHHVHSFSDFESMPDFDFFFSMIVLQHNPPPVIVRILELVLQKLRGGGAAYFQLPTYLYNYSFEIDRYLSLPPASDMEMHPVPQQVLFDMFERHGCQLLECREDPWTESNLIISNSFLVRKSRTKAKPHHRSGKPK
jgi:SAM-dependent methyltransferase